MRLRDLRFVTSGAVLLHSGSHAHRRTHRTRSGLTALARKALLTDSRHTRFDHGDNPSNPGFDYEFNGMLSDAAAVGTTNAPMAVCFWTSTAGDSVRQDEPVNAREFYGD